MPYKLEKISNRENWYQLTDTDSLLYVQWEHGKFNDTQEFEFLGKPPTYDDVKELAILVNKMSNYLAHNHRSIIE